MCMWQEDGRQCALLARESLLRYEVRQVRVSARFCLLPLAKASSCFSDCWRAVIITANALVMEMPAANATHFVVNRGSSGTCLFMSYAFKVS